MVFMYNISSIIATCNILDQIPRWCTMILEVVKNDFVAKWKSGQVYPEITNLIQISNLLDAGSEEVFCTILLWCFPGLFPKYRCEITLTGKRQGG